MSASAARDILMLISVVGMVVFFAMMICTYTYLNKSKNRYRLLELGYNNSEWHERGKVDFVTANFVIINSVFAALLLRHRKKANKQIKQNSIAPSIHTNENYQKLLTEFPGFVRWEIAKFCIGMPSLLSAFIAVDFMSH
jgi:heme/copper-type cytochrome/quinol oxidase subunit 2